MIRAPGPYAAGLTLAFVALAGAAHAQDWKLMKPSTSGIPGEEVRIVRFAPDGHLWVGARWPFWSEGGIGVLDRAADLWTTWSNVDGTFPSAFPNDVAWAPGGVAWIATNDGLVRKEGTDMTVYTTANSPLLHNGIRSVDVDSQGVVWINNTSVDLGLAAIFRFDGMFWSSFQVGAALPWAAPWYGLSDVLVDHQDHVWVANETLNGVAEYDGVSWSLHGADVGRFGEIREDTAGNLWLRAGVGGGGSFWKYDHAAFTKISVGTTPTSIGIDDDGSVYLGDWNGTIRKTADFGQNWTIFASGLNHVFEIEPDPASSEVWIGTQGAVGHFTGGGALLRDYNTINTGMPWYFVDRFDVDSAGNLWLACSETGLSRFDGLRWRNWGEHNAGSEPWPFAGNEPMGAFLLDSTGTGWMGGNGIARWNPDTGDFTGFWNWQNNPGMGVTLFTGFAEDKNGVLFALTQYGAVFRFDPAAQLWVQAGVNVYAPSSAPGIAADSQGNVWVAGWFALHRWDGSAWTTLGDPDWGLFDMGGVNTIAIDSQDRVWLGTEDSLVRWDGTALQVYTPANSPMPLAFVKGIAFRADGAMALSMSKFQSVTPFPNAVAVVNGDILDPASWLVWDYATSPLPHYQLGAVKFDARGNLWISAISEGAAVILNPAQPLALDRDAISLMDGGKVELTLDAGPAYAGRPYLILASVTGTSPGTPLPGGQVLPLVIDPFTSVALAMANSPAMAGFLGTLDGSGSATATLDTLGPLHEPSLVGLELHFAFGVPPKWPLVSNPVTVALLP